MGKKEAVKQFDVLVIGAGSGLEISSEAAARGLKVAVVEPGPFGGTCLNRGCIPSKMLIHHADVMEEIKQSHLFGITTKITRVDWKKIITSVTKFVDEEATLVERGNRDIKNMTIYKTAGKFVGNKLFQVGKEIITAHKIFICAGTRPSIPKIDSLHNVPFITSNEALRLPQQPKKLIILGGGYISAELAHFFGTLGTNITIIQRSNLLMNHEDTEIAQRFTEIYQKKFTVILNATTKKITKKGKNIIVEIENNGKKKNILGDTLLIATGRTPNTDTLNVTATGITINDHGFINVNEFLETNIPGIWAIGDIAGKYQFKHSANLEAAYAANNAFSSTKVPIDYTAMPHAAFASPQVASVGATEDDLKRQKIAYLKGIYDYKNTGYGTALKDTTGFVKVLVNPATKEILGCHIIGPHASILIHEVIIAMKAKLTAQGILDAIHIHPALSEVVQRAFGNIQ